MKTQFMDFDTRTIADLIYLGNNTYLLTRINVPEALRRNGHGTAMLERVCADADACGNAINLEVMPSGQMGVSELVRWYEKHGFRAMSGFLGFIPPMRRLPRRPF